MWNEFSWKVEVFLSKLNFAAIAVVGALVLYFVAPFLAPMVFGARGDLFALVMDWLVIVGLAAAFAAICFIAFARMKRRLRWLAFGAFLLFGSLALFGGWETALSSVDTVLPFKARDVEIARTYYEEPQTGRGALPETGGWHLVTATGEDYRVRDSGDGDQVHAGSYRLQLSHVKELVMSAKAR